MKRWAPLSGIAFLALVVGGGLYGGKPPAENEALKSPNDLAAAYLSQGDKLAVATFLMALGVAFFVYFASLLKTRLDAVAETHCFSRVAFAGALLFTVGAALDFTLMVAMIDGAKDKVDPVAIQALSTLWSNDFVPFAIGIVLFNSGTALAVLRNGGLPKWLGWLSALLAVAALIPHVGPVPIAPFTFPATGLWILIASIVMLVQPRKADA